jgi:hypothetical protein
MPFAPVRFLLLAAALALAGCQAPSLNPLFLPTDRVLLPGFEDHWADAKHNHMFTVKPPQNFTYEVVMRRNGPPSPWTYEARLVKLGDQIYADMLLQSAPEHFDGCIGCIPARSIWKLNLDPQSRTMKPAYLDGAWLNKHLKANPKSIAHVWNLLEGERHAILTAPTEALRAFVTRFAGEKNALNEWETLHRCHH